MYSWLDRAATLAPERVAIERGPERLTYGELLARASEHAAGLAADGVEPGTRWPLAQADPLAFAVALHGALLHGVAVVPIDLRLSDAEQALRRATGGAGQVSGWTGGRGDPSDAARHVATVMYTSGTTSAPKPVELSFGNWLANALGSAAALGLDPAERWLCVMPLAHVGGLSILLRSTVYATTVVQHGRFDTEAVLTDLMDPGQRITLVSLVPTMLSRLLDAGLERPPALRWALLGGGPIPPALLRRAAAAGVPVAPTYGMTEACSQIATFGVPLPGVELAFAADGEVLVRGPVVAAGALAEDGWLHSGDLGELDGDGRLRIVGRRSETIVSGGENVAPAEVEAALLEHPAVADAGVFSRADPEWGEAVIAKVVLRAGSVATPEELRSFTGARLARFKVPKQIEFTEALPRTVSGKLLRRQLD